MNSLPMLPSFFLYPTIKYPTRVTEHSSTLIDNIFSNCIDSDANSVIIYNDISDHFPVAVHLSKAIKKPEQLSYQSRFYNTHSLTLFNNYLSNDERWTEVNRLSQVEKDPNAAYNLFNTVYGELFEICFPLRSSTFKAAVKPQSEWMTQSLIRACNKRSTLYKKYRTKPSPKKRAKYVAYRNKLKTILKKAQKMFYLSKFNYLMGNLQLTWKLLGSITKGHHAEAVTELFTENGVEITDRNVIVDKFNDYFVNIGNLLANSIPATDSNVLDYLGKSQSRSFYMYPTDPNEIISIAASMKNKASFGCDNIPLKIVKSSINSVADVLSNIINSSFTTGIFPDLLKIAKVCPIFENGEKTLFSNYRPISILPSFSKIFEKAVCNRTVHYLDSLDLLCKSQFGFRKHHSTYMALIDMYDRISSAIDNNEFCIGVFIDLSKAFDTLNHNILLLKLEHYGVRGIALKWFKNYLSCRRQYVYLNGSSSALQSITCGVPQGSILGPLLFILYINDITSCSDILRFILFADDTNVFYSCKDIVQLFEIVNVEIAKLVTIYCLDLKGVYYVTR